MRRLTSQSHLTNTTFTTPSGMYSIGGEKDSTNTYHLISKCPETWTDMQTRNRCEIKTHPSIVDLVPVSQVSSMFIFYFRNIHCAVCHGLLTEMEPLNLTLPCVDRDPYEVAVQYRRNGMEGFLFSSGSCELFFDTFNSLELRYCLPVVSTCEGVCMYVDGLENKCRAYMKPVASGTSSGIFYRN